MNNQNCNLPVLSIEELSQVTGGDWNYHFQQKFQEYGKAVKENWERQQPGYVEPEGSVMQPYGPYVQTWLK